ncbi:MAG: hypothetical protein IJF60_03320 [Agathobacter sp.]|nr:hypothetical protein [Agathobacter sp.]
MKKARLIIIAIACICLICGGYFLFSQNNTVSEENLTEVEKVLVKDLKKDYPKTPREVVKFYNRIVKCYYSEKLSDKEIEDMVDQMLYLLDEDLLVVNPRDEYYRSVVADIKDYNSKNKRIVNTDVCDSNDVTYVDDVKDGSNEVDKLAYVNASYFINTDGEFTNTYQQFVLRQDDDGLWKILTFYEVEGEAEEDD